MKLVFSFFLLFAFDAPAKDVCQSRPDLCAKSALAKKKKKRCRKGNVYVACPADTRREIEDIELDFDAMKAESRPRPAPPAPGAVTFESYLQSNFSHPALDRRPSSVTQKAFVPVNRGTVTADPTPAATSPASLAPSPASSPSVETPVGAGGPTDAPPDLLN